MPAVIRPVSPESPVSNPPSDPDRSHRLHTRWTEIRRVWQRSPLASVATVGADGRPHVAPIGSFWLHPTRPVGLYLELFTSQTPRNLETNPAFTAMFVETGASLWLRSLIRGRFPRPVGVRLHGEAAKRRPTEPEEEARFRRLIRPVSWTRGHDILWSRLPYVRDLSFYGATAIRLGAMTKDPALRLSA